MHMTLQKRFSRVDIAAILAFLAIWTYLIVRIRHLYYNPDEYYYLATAQKFALGERPLVDDWHVGQLASLFLVLPYKLFVAICGSTDGIILFSRALFLAFNAVFYWIMYTKLRAYKWPALVATLMFSTNIYGGILSCNYYNMPVRLVMIICLILFSEKQSAASLLTAGVLLACAGIYQPLLLPLYLTYSLLVCIRVILRKKGKSFLEDYDFCLNPRAWKYVSISASLCMIAFLGWLFARSGFRNILASIPFVLFTDSHHDFSTLIQRKLSDLFDLFSPELADIAVLLCVSVIVILSIAFSLGAFRNRRKTMQRILFYSSCAVSILLICDSISDLPGIHYLGVVFRDMTFWIGLECYLLCEQKNKKLFFFWIVALFVSLCVNINTYSGDLSYGSPIAYLASIVFAADLIREFYAERAQTKTKKPNQTYSRRNANRIRHYAPQLLRLIGGCMAFYLILSPLLMNNILNEKVLYGTTISSGPAIRCEKGPAKKLYLREPLWELYCKELSDIDRIKQQQPKNFFVFGLSPELYLYADLPCAGACTWLTPDQSALMQQIRYWEQHVDNIPECIYFPKRITDSDDDAQSFLEWIEESFDRFCSYLLDDGEGGFTLYVSEWDLDSLFDASLFRDDLTK